MPHVQNPPRWQHYLPCGYLQFFAETPEGRDSWIYLYNGKVSRRVKVESQGAEDFTYSKKDPVSAEALLRVAFEDDYPQVARKIINGRSLRSNEWRFLLRFALNLRFRSPKYEISTKEERIDAMQGILGSAINAVEPIRPEDHEPGSGHNVLNRFYLRFKMKVIRLPMRLWVSDNPVIIYEHQQQFAAVIFLPVSPDHLVVFYQKSFISVKSEFTPNDIKRLLLTQRQSRRYNLYYPTDLSHLCSDERQMPVPAENKSEVTESTVVHQYHGLYDAETKQPIYDFIVMKRQ